MSSANNPTKPTSQKVHPHRKAAPPASRTPEQAASAATAAVAMKCPRCDSPNTKFCYYNNYSLTQPRHFCKTCRRYWTKGGALRNVPVGGGCRKNKKLKPCAAAAASSSKDHSLMATAATASSPFGGGFMNLKLFQGISSPPAMDFQLGGLQSNISSNNNNNNSVSSSTSLMMGSFDYDHHHHHHPISLASAHGSLASSIESLSSINQDLHWKLQQQRLAMLFGHCTPSSAVGGQYGATATTPATTQSHHHQTVPILFQNLEISKPNNNYDLQGRKDQQVAIGTDQMAANNAMEWFFGINSFNGNTNSGQNVAHHHDVNSVQTPTSSGSNGNENVTSATNWSNVNGVQAWTTSTADLHQFSAALP